MRTSIFQLLPSAVLALVFLTSASNAQQPYPNTSDAVQPAATIPAAGTLGQPLRQVAQPAPQVAPGQLAQAQLAPGQLAPNQVAGSGGAPMQQMPMGPPFQLSPVEQQFVDQILQEWENRGAEVKTFDCQFERWEYDPVFGPGTEDPAIKSHGRLTYSKPDKGSFKIEKIFRYKKKGENQPADYELQEHEIGEHWVCDGKAVYEYKHDKKQLVVQKLPPDMRGTDIVNGPLPFLFGAEAKKLKARYWMRTKQSDAATILLEAFPRKQVDAANYHHVEVILDRKTMLPQGIQVHMPNGKSRAVYIFQMPTVNGTLDQLFGGLFSSPRTPFGWRKVVVEAPQPGPAAPGPQAAAPQGTLLQ